MTGRPYGKMTHVLTVALFAEAVRTVKQYILVGGIPTSPENTKVSRDDYSQYMIKCSKPPTSIHISDAKLDKICREELSTGKYSTGKLVILPSGNHKLTLSKYRYKYS